ncbi:putative peroxisomal copper amine oxidase [Sugiyamaella lignohabitans]|uniref:Amine oxidase n=1 Tax=Sugiyamaella lignohabitans TaxID=796027 RepID=A0A167DPC7_9ASCO|nr:putative peroxisomal copper amine oxidase [Sugiyamaella lignohabitans]ANB13134.1 putative peroxisomal copper amine oxidase [Sugiyamaella lignohabitans]
MPHPLDQLNPEELQRAVGHLKNYHKGKQLHIKNIHLEEPPKSLLGPYLQAEKAGKPIAPPPRIAYGYYYIMDDKKAEEIWIDLDTNQITKVVMVALPQHLPMDQDEANHIETFMYDDPLVLGALKECGIEGEAIKTVASDGWMYGCDEITSVSRHMMFLMYSRDPKTNHPESNIYAFPLPFVPVYDILEKKFVRIDWCATSGDDDDANGINYTTRQKYKFALEGHQASEYYPDLVPNKRTDLKPYNVLQPEGPSFTVDESNLVQWQKWRFRVGFNPREGLVLHDVDYDGRRTFYRLSVSEMAVPYGDPRPPLHRKMAFDFGDVGGGKCANELSLGCDCLGTIKYFDGHLVEPNGNVLTRKGVICMHEQDDGILWKHTNYRTEAAAVVRRRILVLQTILTVGNYEYIFAWHLDQAANIQLEIRATGIVSTQAIDHGKRSRYGTVVGPGVLATSHQHIFSVRIDPAIDGNKNSVSVHDTVITPWDERNPKGTGFINTKRYIDESSAFDANIASNRYVKIVNENKINPITGNPVGFKLAAAPTALLMAPPGTVARSRAAFATHHFWVTKHKDNEFYAGGVWTNQSAKEVGGVQEAVNRRDNVRNEDIVLWHSFGLTHHPRIEDYPVMPVEVLKVGLHPNDFFTENPAIDVPPSTQQFNRSVEVFQTRSCHRM